MAKEQNKLIDRIKDIDLIASHICEQFLNERQRRLNNVFENCSKIEEINWQKSVKTISMSVREVKKTLINVYHNLCI